MIAKAQLRAITCMLVVPTLVLVPNSKGGGGVWVQSVDWTGVDSPKIPFSGLFSVEAEATGKLFRLCIR